MGQKIYWILIIGKKEINTMFDSSHCFTCPKILQNQFLICTKRMLVLFMKNWYEFTVLQRSGWELLGKRTVHVWKSMRARNMSIGLHFITRRQRVRSLQPWQSQFQSDGCSLPLSFLQSP